MAIRLYGVPVITCDDHTTIEEAFAQLLLTAHWYGYLPADETSDILQPSRTHSPGRCLPSAPGATIPMRFRPRAVCSNA